MSASQQARDPQGEQEIALASAEPNPADVDGVEGALEAEALTNTAMEPEFRHSPRESAQPIFERDAYAEDLQPMLDLRFPEEPQAAQTEPEVTDEFAFVLKPMSGMATSDKAELPVHPDLDPPIGGTHALNGAGYAAGVDAPDVLHGPGDVEEAQENPLGQPPAVSSVDDASEYAGHATAADADIGGRSQFDVQDTLQQDAEERPGSASSHHDTAAERIAAEASATAEALDNLKRLLAHKMPELAPESGLQRPPFLAAKSSPEFQPIDRLRSANETDVLAHEHLTPVDFAAPEAVTKLRREGFEFRGFLAGFALSWAFGAALYAYLVFS